MSVVGYIAIYGADISVPIRRLFCLFARFSAIFQFVFALGLLIPVARFLYAMISEKSKTLIIQCCVTKFATSFALVICAFAALAVFFGRLLENLDCWSDK